MNTASRDHGAVDWDHMTVALLEFVGRRVVIDAFAHGTMIPVAGLEGILIDAQPTSIDGVPDAFVAIALRVRS